MTTHEKDINTVSDVVLEQLRFLDGDGDYYATTGVTFTMMYAQRMGELIPVFRQMAQLFDAYIQPNVLNYYIRSEDWRPYNPKQLERMLNKFSGDAENGEELLLGKLGGEFQHFGEYGLRIKGRCDEKDSPFRHRDVCAAYFELPMHEVERVGREKLIKFVQTIANLAPFVHGTCGYNFKYFHRQGDSDIHEWMGQNALRFTAIHPFTNDWEYCCRNFLPNVNWITLLGHDMVAKLSGVSSIRSALDEQVEGSALTHGCMLVAGSEPPLGDVNQQAQDIEPLRQVAKLTQPILLPREDQANNILNQLYAEEDDRYRWLDRFDKKS
jgi:hypothetical protein